MRSISSQLTLTFLRKKEPGLSEIFTLINLDEEPCALLDVKEKTILFINSRLMKLTSFSSVELSNQEASLLFPDLHLDSVSSGETQLLNLITKDGKDLEFAAKFNFFDPETHWLIIRLITKKEPPLQKQNYSDMVYQEISRFISVVDFQDFEHAIERVTELTRRILNADVTCFYQADASSPHLILISQSGTKYTFPDNLPSTDLIRLTNTELWEPGQRVVTDIHRFSRSTSLDYLATAVLTQDGAKTGLITAGGVGKIPAELNMNALELMSALVTSYYQKSLLVKNLDQKMTSQKRDLGMLGNVVENLQEGLVILSPQLKIIQVNPAAEWMFGYSDKEMKGQDVENILIGADRLMPSLVDAKNGNATPDIGKSFLNRRNGQSFPVQMKVIPVMEESRVSNIEILITDISENEQSKALAKHLEHRAIIGDYTAAIAHDAKNPLNSIYSGVQLLGSQIPSDDPKQETINKILNDCTRLTHLIESFLAYARPGEEEHSVIDLSFFLQRMVDRWRPRFSKVNVNPVTSFEPGLAKVRGDSRSLDRVFTNLVSNAVDAMAEVGGTLAVKGEMDRSITGHPYVVIHISDTGPGIPGDLQQHIFEPFVTTREKGTGLGLAITKQIITAHKGSIKVDSFPGGTVFTVRLPAESGD
jgi:PAS domain S-box-containing protein